MASVWAARLVGKHGFEKLVAIKTILPRFAGDVHFQEMFLDEARIAARLEHVNVARILDLGEEHQVLYLAMEYVDGDALSALFRACQRRRITIPAGIVLRVLADTCAGLHEAHELRDAAGKPLEIVHRDVSPHNVLVSSKGIAKLIDFGIAKARSRIGKDTNAGVLKGKIQYMAPEQALGRPVDRRTDVWAVGAILYQLLAGRPPYQGENQLRTLERLASGRPPLPLPPGVHPAIGRVVRKALAHVRENRYETAAELGETLEHALREARLATTAADVAAFFAEHLEERAARRRHGIDLALTAAAERPRLEDTLRPTRERFSVTGRSAGSLRGTPAGRTPPAPRSGPRPILPRTPPRPSWREGVVAAAALVATVAAAAAVATGLSGAMVRSRAQSAATTPPGPAQPTLFAEEALSAAGVGAAPIEPVPRPPRSLAAGIPAAGAVPSLAVPPSVLRRAPSVRAPPPAATVTLPIAIPRPEPSVDDGF